MNFKIFPDTFSKEELETWMSYMHEIGNDDAIIEKIKYDLREENKKNGHAK